MNKYYDTKDEALKMKITVKARYGRKQDTFYFSHSKRYGIEALKRKALEHIENNTTFPLPLDVVYYEIKSPLFYTIVDNKKKVTYQKESFKYYPQEETFKEVFAY